MASTDEGSGDSKFNGMETVTEKLVESSKFKEKCTENLSESTNLVDIALVNNHNEESKKESETMLCLGGASLDNSEKELVDFKVIYNKQKFDVNFPLDDTVADLKKHIHTLTGVPSSMQKLMFKGLAKDDKTLRELNVTMGAKLMVVGSTLTDVLAVSSPDPNTLKEDKTKPGTAAAKEFLSSQKLHKKIIDKGKPDDVMPGIKNSKDSLPSYPLSGMVNKSGGKVRLTFKLEQDQLWIGTKERTDKIPMNSIKNVISEPIESFEDYHIMGIQLGPTEASRYWIYWVPAQYADAIKDAILGKWQFF